MDLVSRLGTQTNLVQIISSLVLGCWLNVLIFLPSLLTFFAYPLSPFFWLAFCCVYFLVWFVYWIYTMSLTTVLAIEHTITSSLNF